MSTVLVFGTFDPVHAGHCSYFLQARSLGEIVVCVVARDRTVQHVKGHEPYYSETERLEAVMNTGLLDEVRLGNEENVFDVLSDVRPNIVLLGYDQVSFTDELESELRKRALSSSVVRARPYKPELYKSSLIKARQMYANV